MNRSMTLKALLIGGLLAGSLLSAAQAADFWQYPAIPGFGPVHVWPEATLKPQADMTYKAVFDLTQAGKGLDKLNPGFDHIARTVNVFAAAGVPVEHLKFIVIIHGPATPIALSEKAFEAKFHHPNPNLKVIAALRKAGVELYVCGNALADMHYTPAEINPEVKIAMSALSTLILEQNQGYALMRM
ncbi:MAG: DsrE family protein [Gammaproteobacteria bacterium]|nr:DsrE family protein [Gammaproteobacteria bacterium]